MAQSKEAITLGHVLLRDANRDKARMLTDRAQSSGGHAECSSWGGSLVVPPALLNGCCPHTHTMLKAGFLPFCV